MLPPFTSRAASRWVTPHGCIRRARRDRRHRMECPREPARDVAGDRMIGVRTRVKPRLRSRLGDGDGDGVEKRKARGTRPSHSASTVPVASRRHIVHVTASRQSSLESPQT